MQVDVANAPARGAQGESVDFRDFLQSELVRRCKVNPRYSLRAFARYLKLESSYLSKLLQGKRAVTEKLIERVRAPLALGPDQVERFHQNARRSKQDRRKQRSRTTVAEFKTLTVDSFYVVSEWYHYAILELTSVQGFKADARWIGRILDLPVPVVNAALERLIRLGMLKEENGVLTCKENHTTVGNDFTHAAFRNLQRSVLQMALKALDEVPFEQRDHSSITMAINSKHVPEARRRIKQFRRELMSFLQQPGERDMVYQMGIALYPVSKSDSKVHSFDEDTVADESSSEVAS